MKWKMLWVPGESNDKTGPVPAGYVGSGDAGNHYDANVASCAGCPLQETTCYFHMGQVKRALFAIGKAHRRDEAKGGIRYSLADALKKSRRMARYARGAVGGDPSVFPRGEVEGWIAQMQKSGLIGLLLYTHFWATKGAHLKGLAMASCDSLSEADVAVAAGWRAAVVLPVRLPTAGHRRVKDVAVWEGEMFATPAGEPVTICPAQRPDLRKDCNTCGLCDAQRHPHVKIIGFFQH